MKILYYIYQICIALPILLVLTILTAIVTIVGSLVGGAHFWGYYPGKIWSQLICLFLLIPVKIRGREKLHGKTSYIFGPERSTKICPALSQAFPTNGSLRRLFFIIHLKFLPMKP